MAPSTPLTKKRVGFVRTKPDNSISNLIDNRERKRPPKHKQK